MKKASNCCGMVMIVLFTAVGVVTMGDTLRMSRGPPEPADP
jgi:hypothetical protein